MMVIFDWRRSHVYFKIDSVVERVLADDGTVYYKSGDYWLMFWAVMRSV